MYGNLLALAEQAVATALQGGSALPEALRISGIGLIGIFFVMGLFGALITLLSFLFPEAVDESK
jgi:hypothetical protein